MALSAPDDRMIAAARARGERERADGTFAVAARYDAKTDRVVVDLANGAAFAIPASRIEGLAGAVSTALSGVTVEGAGESLHWPALDLDVSVRGLLSGVFGTRAWMAREFARMGGAATSPAKAVASRSNGAKGGRPKKELSGA